MRHPAELTDRNAGIVRRPRVRVDHHRVEARVDAALRLVKGVSLVEEQRDVHGTSRRIAATDGTEDLDATAVEPLPVHHHRAETENHGGGLLLRGGQHGLERARVPRLEVPDRVPVRPCCAQESLQRDEGHLLAAGLGHTDLLDLH